MRSLSLMALALACAAVAACSSDAPDTVPVATQGGPSAQEAAEPPVEPPPPRPGSELLLGTFEFRTTHREHEVRLGLAFDGTTLIRSTAGAETARETARVIDDGPGTVLLEVIEPGPPKQRAFEFDGPNVVFDPVAPDVRYERVIPYGSAPEGSGG